MSINLSKIKKYIAEVIEDELEEASVTGALDGGEGPPKTPYAFRGKKKKDKDKEEEISTNSTGYKKASAATKARIISDLSKYESVNEDVWTPAETKAVDKIEGEFQKLMAKKGIEPYSVEASRLWRSAGFNKKMRKIFGKDESVNEGQKRRASDILRKFDMAYIKFSQEVRDVMKLMDKSTGNKTDSRIINKAYGKHLIPFDDIMQSWARGQQSNPNIDESLNEGKYHDYRNDESMTPKQKIGHSMREVKNSLNELSKLIDMNVRLKKEMNVNSGSYWKNTHKALHKISERLVKLANKVGKLQ